MFISHLVKDNFSKILDECQSGMLYLLCPALPNLVLTDGYLSFDYPERLGKGGAICDARLHLSLAFSYAQVRSLM